MIPVNEKLLKKILDALPPACRTKDDVDDCYQELELAALLGIPTTKALETYAAYLRRHEKVRWVMGTYRRINNPDIPIDAMNIGTMAPASQYERLRINNLRGQPGQKRTRVYLPNRSRHQYSIPHRNRSLAYELLYDSVYKEELDKGTVIANTISMMEGTNVLPAWLRNKKKVMRVDAKTGRKVRLPT